MGTLMLESEKAGQGSVAVAGQKPHAVIGIDEIDRSGAHVEDAEHAGLNAELPFAVKKCLVPVNGEGFAEIGGKDAREVEALRKLPVGATEMRPAGIGMERGEQAAVRQPV